MKAIIRILAFAIAVTAAATTSLAPTTAHALPAPVDMRGPMPSPNNDTANEQASQLATRTPGAPLHIMIDPGHGGVDTGAVRGKLKEAEIALKVSARLAEMLKADPRFKVSMTRTSDTALTLPKRTQLAQEAKVDLFVSIHLNSSNDPRAHGKEFYFQNQLPVDEESMFIASRENAENEMPANGTATKSESLSSKTDLRRILDDLKRNERIFASSELSQVLHETWIGSGKGRKIGSRAIRQAPFYVVSNVTMPSVLVELGFLSHPQEGQRLAHAEYQKELAKSLYSGLVKFKEIMDKDRGRNLNSANDN